MEDYLEAGAAIVSKLGELGGIRQIYTPADLQDMIESSQICPCLHVMYMGDIVGESADRGRSNVIDQKWLIVLGVRNSKSQLQDTSETRKEAGLLIKPMLDLLKGFQPVEWMRPLVRVNGPAAGYSSSFAYFPFMFQGRIINS